MVERKARQEERITVSIRNVKKSDWAVITNLAANLNMTVAEIIEIVVDRIRSQPMLTGMVARFAAEQSKKRRELLKNGLFGENE
ncbi:MAG: hypothetical protein LN415_00920 [Candidatus Thermoplasmatota archaeon]|nr:hypothetical protein [Candidatus Thermoplasmatota archaeon]